MFGFLSRLFKKRSAVVPVEDLVKVDQDIKLELVPIVENGSDSETDISGIPDENGTFDDLNVTMSDVVVENESYSETEISEATEVTEIFDDLNAEIDSLKDTVSQLKKSILAKDHLINELQNEIKSAKIYVDMASEIVRGNLNDNIVCEI